MEPKQELFTKQYDESKALEEIHALLDKKKVLPRRREAIEPAIQAVVEAMVYGYVGISEDGKITQKLIEAVDNVSELVYKPHVTAAIMNKELGMLKNYTQVNISLAYISMYTDRPTSQINRLEPSDRNIADSIAFFFQ